MTLALTDPRLTDTGLQADGVLEMWYASIDDMEQSLASDQAQKAMQHGSEFLSTITTYLVEEIRIAP